MNQRVFIIAEAGVNHNGDIRLAKKLIDIAVESGADAVKFQTFKAEKLVTNNAQLADYQNTFTNKNQDNQLSMLKRLEFTNEDHFELIKYCKKKNILFLSTGFDEVSIDFLNNVGVPFFKIPSGEITNKPYLKHIANKGKPVILSTGMSNLNEIDAALKILTLEGLSLEQITVLHCNTEYPTPMQDVNLKAMINIGNQFNVKIGYSDHTLGIEVPIAAVAMGARVIEKHFTIDRNMSGPDHKASLEPHELKAMIQAIRNVELAISGDGLKKPSLSEKKNTIVARKSIHLAKKIQKGEIITQEHLIMKRPGDGISPMEIDNVVGKIIILDLEPDSKLTWEMIK